MIGFHASHEQFAPSKLLKLAIEAEKAGFDAISSSDHFYPWGTKQAQSGFAWSWLGAAMNATSLPFSVVTTPSYRYHPAILAQAAATLSEMFPDRFTICLGSGELLNEAITGTQWPPKEIRNQRLKESANIIKRLWNGETITQNNLITIQETKLYIKPKNPPKMMCAAISKQTSEWLGTWTDGLMTVGTSEKVKENIDAFRKNGGTGKPIHVKVDVSYAPTYNEAVESAWEHWRYAMLGNAANTMLRTPEMFDETTSCIQKENMPNLLFISTKPDEHIKYLQNLLDLGLNHLTVHNVNTEQERFIEFYKTQILPAIKK